MTGPSVNRIQMTIARSKKVLGLLASLVACFTVSLTQGTTSHAAEKRCPSWTAADKPRLTNIYRYAPDDGPRELGLPFETPAYFWRAGEWFKMPLGYRNPWPFQKRAEEITNLPLYKEWLARNREHTGFHQTTEQYRPKFFGTESLAPPFSFWMPSMRYVERRQGWTKLLRPCEAGRPAPKADQYVVRFRIEWAFAAGSELSVFARPFLNSKRALESRGRPPNQSDNGSRQHTLSGPISGHKDYDIYSDDGDVFALLRCSAWLGFTQRIARAPSCSGHVWKRSSNVILFLIFPSDRGQFGYEERWREVVDGALLLLQEWHSAE